MSTRTIHHRTTNQDPTTRTEPPRVLIADQDGLARRMLHTALHDAGAILTVPAATNAREALQLTRYYHPTILIIDTALPPNGCLELIPKIHHAAPHTRILTISAGEDDETALAALHAGAIGYISKDQDPPALAHLITLAANGEAIIPRRLATSLLGLLQALPDTGWRPINSRLTTREWQIVELLTEHRTTQEIAERLVLSPSTIYSHVKNILRKLEVHTRQDAVTTAKQLRHQETEGTTTPTPIHPGK
jgi:DNA-binding NarL/FixJ family response regulator